MRVIKLVIYDGSEEWVKKTLAQSIRGTLFIGRNLIQTVILERAQPQSTDTTFVCQRCGKKFPAVKVTSLGGLLTLCNPCSAAVKEEILQKA